MYAGKQTADNIEKVEHYLARNKLLVKLATNEKEGGFLVLTNSSYLCHDRPLTSNWFKVGYGGIFTY